MHKLISLICLCLTNLVFTNTASARFLQTDPIGYEDQMNLYTYVANDPMNATDPSGMQAEQFLGVYFGSLLSGKTHEESARNMHHTIVVVGEASIEVLDVTSAGYILDVAELASNAMSGEQNIGKITDIGVDEIVSRVIEKVLEKKFGSGIAESASAIAGKVAGDAAGEGMDSYFDSSESTQDKHSDSSEPAQADPNGVLPAGCRTHSQTNCQ